MFPSSTLFPSEWIEWNCDEIFPDSELITVNGNSEIWEFLSVNGWIRATIQTREIEENFVSNVWENGADRENAETETVHQFRILSISEARDDSRDDYACETIPAILTAERY